MIAIPIGRISLPTIPTAAPPGGTRNGLSGGAKGLRACGLGTSVIGTPVGKLTIRPEPGWAIVGVIGIGGVIGAGGGGTGGGAKGMF